MNAKALRCLTCDVDMNMHAEILRDDAGADDQAHVDRELGGVLESVHCCPQCGETTSRLES